MTNEVNYPIAKNKIIFNYSNDPLLKPVSDFDLESTVLEIYNLLDQTNEDIVYPFNNFVMFDVVRVLAKAGIIDNTRVLLTTPNAKQPVKLRSDGRMEYKNDEWDYQADDLNVQCCMAILGFNHPNNKQFFKSTLKID